MPVRSGPDQFEAMDLSGVACPLNYVKIRVQLSSMSKGDKLEVILDDGKPIQQVPTSLDMDGCQILSMMQREDNRWRLLIKKTI